MTDEAQGRRIAQEVIAAARRAAGAAEVHVAVIGERSANTRFARNQITSTGDVVETTVEVEVAIGKRVASASGNQTDPAALRALADMAVRMARVAPEDPERMPILGAQTYPKTPPAWDDATAGWSAT